jgi:CheY-like chemotaxis protein
MESVGRLAGGVAHDYNNALTVIMGYTELAMTHADPTEPWHADLNEVLKASRRAKDITRKLLAFARKQTITPKVLDLNENVKNMLKMLEHLIGEEIDLAWLPGKDLLPVKMDPSQIDQILANLCVNARDAINGIGKITIETEKVVIDAAYCADHAGFVPGDFVLMAVSDNGCGMDKEILDNIYEPFFTTKDIDKGTGLGLPTVYGIVKQNNGFINVYSEPGKGTVAKIYLPPHGGNPVKIQGKKVANVMQGHGETILVVEDDLLILKLTEKIFNGLDYTLLTAGTPKAAIRLTQEHTGKIHLLITDVIMPEMNGRELAEQLQSLFPDLKCIFMSGYTADALAHQEVLKNGAFFIQKPFSKIDLTTIVRKILGNSSITHQG